MLAIEIQNLAKTYSLGLFKGSVKALDSVSLTVSEGEIFGFLGPNGAGKTTTLKIMTGLNRSTSGSILLFGQDCKNQSVREIMGYLPEQPYFYDYLTAREFLAFYARLFGFKKSVIDSKIAELLKMVSLERARDLPLRKFSKGMLQRIGIAQALVNDPKLVVFDEPMSGLDPIGRREVRDLILRMKHEGKTVFFSSHIISDVEMICDRVAILDKGKIRAEGKIDDLLQKKSMTREMEFSVSNPEIIQLLGSLGTIITKTPGRLLISVSEEHVEQVLDLARLQGAKLLSLVVHKQSLEELFTEKVSRSERQ
jgi:ABC-2 type transport system ATP-binding protein